MQERFTIMQVKCRKDAGLGSTLAKDAGHFCRSCRGGELLFSARTLQWSDCLSVGYVEDKKMARDPKATRHYE